MTSFPLIIFVLIAYIHNVQIVFDELLICVHATSQFLQQIHSVPDFAGDALMAACVALSMLLKGHH